MEYFAMKQNIEPIKLLVDNDIIIIMSRHQHGFSWPSSATLLPGGLQGYILCMLALDGHPAFARPFEGVHRSTSLMSWSLLIKQCPTYLVRLTLIVFMMGGRWSYSSFFVGCYLQYLFNIARSILVYLTSSFFSIRLFSIHVAHPYSGIDTTTACKNGISFYWTFLTPIWPVAYR